MTYIAISYVLMLVWAIYTLLFKMDSPKDIIKMLIMAPLTLPVLLFITFIAW
jgi:hypothetical protein